MIEFLLAPVLVGLTTLGCLFYLIPQAARVGLVDAPGGRKHHTQPTPVVGGIAIVLGITTLFMFPTVWQSSFIWLFPALICLATVGLLDDKRELSPKTRITAQIGAALLVVYGGNISLTSIGNLLGNGTIMLGATAVILTLFAILSAINAFNMIDGLDGLSGGITLIPLVVICVLAGQAGLASHAIVAGGFATAVLAFLLLNYRFPWNAKAKVFLGDTGSTILGFVVAVLVISASESGLFKPVTALFLLGIPLLDIAAVTTLRLLQGRSPFSPGRDHIHHILRRAGLGVRTTVLSIHTASLALVALGLGLDIGGAKENTTFIVFIALLVAHICITTKLNLDHAATTNANGEVELNTISIATRNEAISTRSTYEDSLLSPKESNYSATKKAG